MKVTVDKKEIKGNSFPKIMISGDTIVLFTKPCIGITIANCDDYSVGSLSSGWDMDMFSDFYGTITLEN